MNKYAIFQEECECVEVVSSDRIDCLTIIGKPRATARGAGEHIRGDCRNENKERSPALVLGDSTVRNVGREETKDQH